MRRLVLAAAVAVAMAPGVVRASGWDRGANEAFDGFAEAVTRAGHRPALVDRGCAGAAWLVCDLQIRDIPVRVRADLPPGRIREVQMTLSARTTTANAAAGLHTLLLWAEPQASDDARRAAVLAILQGQGSRRSADVGRTHIEATEGFGGWTVVARPR